MDKKTVKTSNLKAGLELPFLVEKIKMETPAEYKMGQVIQIDPTSKKGNKCTDATKIYGICCDNITTTKADEEIQVYVTGIFCESEILHEDSVELDDIKFNGRKNGIYFRK